MSKIVYKNKDLVLILKSAGASSQPDNTGGEDALSMTSRLLSGIGESSALFPVHRLDKVVGGLLAFARNKQTAAELSRQLIDGEFNKEYLAVVEGCPTGGVLIDFLKKNASLGKAQISDEKSGKRAELEFNVLETLSTPKGDRTLVKIVLKTGRFHQIRSQFSLRDYPLVGDKKYGSNDHRAKTPALFAYRLSLKLKDKELCEKVLPDISEYPWSLFNREIYNEV